MIIQHASGGSFRTGLSARFIAGLQIERIWAALEAMLEPIQTLEHYIDDLDDYLEVLANNLKTAKCQFQIEHIREDIDSTLDQRLETARRIRLSQRLTLTKHPLFG